MANSIKGEYGEDGSGLRLQVTNPARQAGLVTEDAEGNAKQLAGVYVYGFDGVLLVVGAEDVSAAHRAELVASAARDTDSVHRGAAASVATAGNGYQVQLPGCKAAGFTAGDRAPASAAPGVLVIHDGTQARLVDDLMTQRQAQLDSGQ